MNAPLERLGSPDAPSRAIANDISSRTSSLLSTRGEERQQSLCSRSARHTNPPTSANAGVHVSLVVCRDHQRRPGACPRALWFALRPRKSALSTRLLLHTTYTIYTDSQRTCAQRSLLPRTPHLQIAPAFAKFGCLLLWTCIFLRHQSRRRLLST